MNTFIILTFLVAIIQITHETTIFMIDNQALHVRQKPVEQRCFILIPMWLRVIPAIFFLSVEGGVPGLYLLPSRLPAIIPVRPVSEFCLINIRLEYAGSILSVYFLAS